MRTWHFSIVASGLALAGCLMASQSVWAQAFSGPVANGIDARQDWRVQERRNERWNNPYTPNRPVARGLAAGAAAVARGAESATAHAAAGAANAAAPFRPGSPAFHGPYTAGYGGNYYPPSRTYRTYNDYNSGSYSPPQAYGPNAGYRSYPPAGAYGPANGSF